METFVTGFLQNSNYDGWPAALMVMQDGSPLISDRYNGTS